MARFSDTLIDQYQRPIGGVLVSVTLSSMGAVADLTDDSGNDLGNPILTYADGTYSFNVDPGVYDLVFRLGGREINKANSIVIGDVSVLPAGSVADFLGTSTTVAPSQRAVNAGLAVYLPLLPLASSVFNGKTDGTDVSTLLLAMATVGPVTLAAGVYAIGASVTLPNQISFQAGARLAITAGATVTFNGGVNAPDIQIFNGAGAVAGLVSCRVMWFAGDLLNTQTVAISFIQKAYNACQQGAPVYWPLGYFSSDGSVAISIAKAQQTIGVGKNSSRLNFTTTNTTGFLVTGQAFARFTGIGSFSTNRTLIATAGTVFEVRVLYVDLENIQTDMAYVSVSFTSGSAGGTLTDFILNNSMSIGFYATGMNDVFVSNGLILSGANFVTVSGVVGTFLAGEQVRGTTSSAVGTLNEISSATLFRVSMNDLNFTVSETITGLTTGATATVSAQIVGHSGGGIRLADRVEAAVFENIDVIGGAYAVTTAAAVFAHGSCPAFCNFSNMYFDGADGGCNIIHALEFEWIGCWWSDRPSNGALFTDCDGMKFTGGKALYSYQNGIVIGSGCTNTVFNGMSLRANGEGGAGTFAGLFFQPGCSKFIVSNCIGDDTIPGGGGTQGFAVVVQAGASDRYNISNNRIPAGLIQDLGTGANKFVGNNF